MKQTGYLLTAGVTVSQMLPSGNRGINTLQSWDTCVTIIVYAGDIEEAQRAFEAGGKNQRSGDDPHQTEIKKINSVEVVNELLTESGGEPLNWREIARRVVEPADAPKTAGSTEDPEAEEDAGEEGYWVDVNQVVPAESAGLSLESLKQGLPDDISSALNWSAERQFVFLVSSLRPRPVFSYREDIEETEEAEGDETVQPDPMDSRPALDEWVTSLPEMRERETVAVVEARNSVVAGWIFRKFAPGGQGEILVNPCCQIIAGGSEVGDKV
jgi:hypothetical protein